MRSKSLLLALALVGPLLSSPALAQAPENACRALVTKLVDAQLKQQLSRNRVQAEAESRSDDVGVQAASMSDSASRVAPRKRPAAKPAPSRARRSKASSGARSSGGMNKSAAAGPSRYSRTNTQELSVDEGDIVKTDGRHVYHVSCNRTRHQSGCRNEIRIFKSWPAQQTRLLTRFQIPSPHKVPTPGQETPVQQLYLQGDQLVVVMSGWSQAPHPGVRRRGRGRHYRRRRGPQHVRVVIVDVQNPAAPRVKRDYKIDGAFVESRMIGSRFYIATSVMGPRLPEDMQIELRRSYAFASGELSLDEVMAKLDAQWSHFINVDPGLPRAQELTSQKAAAPIYGCSDLHLSEHAQGNYLLNLAHIDITRDGPVTGAGVSGYSSNSKVYASEAPLYVADLASPQGKAGWSSATLIRKFDLSQGGRPKFQASGLVRGTLLNQFSMSEDGGFLRVASSDGWQSNNLYVLSTEEDQLQTIGTLENLGRGERIYAVRMMADKGYVVTFRRTDPLYTLDLSDPKRPEVVGELKIEGFSNYLHPLDKDHLLAIGQDANARGRATGFHLQIFDISDLKNPRRTHHEKLAAGSNSAAQGDHHAFMFEAHTQTLALPWKGSNYWGLVAYHVDARKGFRALGRVNHATMYKRYFQKRCRTLDRAECGKKNYWWRFFSRQDLAVDRVIAIEDNLFSFSPSGAMVHRVGRRLQVRRTVLVNEPQWGRRASK